MTQLIYIELLFIQSVRLHWRRYVIQFVGRCDGPSLQMRGQNTASNIRHEHTHPGLQALNVDSVGTIFIHRASMVTIAEEA
jgi:hypothetical protein